MMMRCLEAGGMNVACDQSQEYLNVLFGSDGYAPNDHGFYALDADFRAVSFATEYDGCAVKVPHSELLHLPQHEYRLLWLHRNPQEIIASMHRFMPDVWDEEAAALLADVLIPALLAQAAERGDMTVQTLEYTAIVADPQAQFTSLNWPMNVGAAATMVEPSLYRFRLENL